MPYTSPATVVTGTTITSAWGNSVKAGEDYLANPPATRVFHNTTQATVSGTELSIAFNSEAFKTVAGMHSNVTNNSRITLTDAGIYQVSWGFTIAADTDYLWVYSYARLNGATLIILGSSVGTQTDNGLSPHTSGSGLYKFAANDYIEVRAAQKNTSAGGNLVSANNYFSAVWVGLG